MLLERYQANPSLKNLQGLTPKDVATDMVRAVIAEQDLSLLYRAAESGSLDEFLSRFKRFSTRPGFPEGNIKPILLHLACRGRNQAVIRQLAQRLQTPLNYKIGGTTPLYHAVRAKDYELIYLLLQLGADKRVAAAAAQESLLTEKDKIIRALLREAQAPLNGEHDHYCGSERRLITSFHVLHQRASEEDVGEGGETWDYIYSSSGSGSSSQNVHMKQVERFCKECLLAWEDKRRKGEVPLGFYSFAMTDRTGVKSFGHVGVFAGSENGFPAFALCILSPWPYFAFFRSLIQQQLDPPAWDGASLEDAVSFIKNMCSPLMKLHILPTSMVTLPEGVLQGKTFNVPSFRQMPYVDDDCFHLLASCISMESLVSVFSAMLTEQRVLLLTDYPEKLTPVCEALTSLLFPFEWNHIYVPLLSADAMEVVQAPLPFLLGIQTDQLKSIPGETLTSLVLVFLDRNSVVLPMHFGNGNLGAPHLGTAQAQATYETEHRYMSLPDDMQEKLLDSLNSSVNSVARLRCSFFTMLIDLISPLHAFDFEKRKVGELLTTRYITSKPFYETVFETQVWKSFHHSMTNSAACFETDLKLSFIKEILDRRLGLERVKIVAESVRIYKHRTVMSRKLGKLVRGDTVYIEKHSRSTSTSMRWSKPRDIAGWCLLRDKDYELLDDVAIPFERYITGTKDVFFHILDAIHQEESKSS